MRKILTTAVAMALTCGAAFADTLVNDEEAKKAINSYVLSSIVVKACDVPASEEKLAAIRIDAMKASVGRGDFAELDAGIQKGIVQFKEDNAMCPMWKNIVGNRLVN